MTVAQLQSVMKYQLQNFNDEGVPITDDTIHNQVLSEDDGYDSANSKELYHGVIRWTLWQNDHADPAWPADWMKQSVQQLAPALLPRT